MARTALSAAANASRRRMRAPDRRRQLLDELARIVLEDGMGAVTMESLARRSGVSKALPYRHFSDADAALVALYRRETSALGSAIVEALENAPPGADRVQVSVAAYFDALLPRRDLLRALSSAGRGVPALADPDDAATRFAESLLRRYHGLDDRRSRAVAGMVHGAIVGAAATVLADAAPRKTVERSLAEMLRAALA